MTCLCGGRSVTKSSLFGPIRLWWVCQRCSKRTPRPYESLAVRVQPAAAGTTPLRVVASEPGSGGSPRPSDPNLNCPHTSTRSVCPCVGFDGRCHECDDPYVMPACSVAVGPSDPNLESRTQ